MSGSTKRIIVMSDSGGNNKNFVEKLVGKYYENNQKLDIIIHLGNGLNDIKEIPKLYKDIEIIRVSGNQFENVNKIHLKKIGNIQLICRHNAFGNNKDDQENFDPEFLRDIIFSSSRFRLSAEKREDFKESNTIVLINAGKNEQRLDELANYGISIKDKDGIVMSPGSIKKLMHSYIEIDHDGSLFIENRYNGFKVADKMLIPLTNFEKGLTEYEEKLVELMGLLIETGRSEYLTNFYSDVDVEKYLLKNTELQEEMDVAMEDLEL